ALRPRRDIGSRRNDPAHRDPRPRMAAMFSSSIFQLRSLLLSKFIPGAATRRAIAATALLTAAAAGSAAAQTSDEAQPRRWDFLISSGTVVPTGDQRAVIKRGNLTAAQLSYALRPSLALNATVGWAR